MSKLLSSAGYALSLCIISYTCTYCSSLDSQHTEHNKRDIQELMLDMWSQLDLIQAITVTPEQQELFTHALACQALDLYAALQIQHENITKLHEYQDLCMTLRTTSAELFSSVSTSAVHALLFVLDTLIDKLETPGNITGERSTQQIGLKHVFTL